MNEEEPPQASEYLRFLWGPTGPPREPPASPPIVPLRKERQCLNADGNPKRRHRTEALALIEVEAIRRRRGFVERASRPLHAYPCEKCDAWHVGKVPKRRKTSPQPQP